MVKPLLLQLGVVIFASIASSRCSFLSRSLECSLQGATFGGRLVFVDGGGLRSGLLPHLAHRERMIIFQTPPAHLRSHMGSGRGQIWIGSRTSSCQSSDSQPGHSPWNEDRPCLDSGIPCVTEPPSFVQPNPLEFSEVTEDSITVSWPAWDETTDPGVGPITGYKILYREQDGIFEEILLDGDLLSHRFDDLTEGTIYQFRVVLVREGEPPEGPSSKIQNVTTHCSVPVGAPSDLQPVTKRNRIQFLWNEPRCGENNEEIIRYEYNATKNGVSGSGRKRPHAKQYVIRPLQSGDEWHFEVRACTEAGCGPYAQANGIMN